MERGKAMRSPGLAAHGHAGCVEAYQRIAAIYDVVDSPYEYLWKRRLRRALFGRTAGRILDAGVGTGRNMPFYPIGAEVTGIDISAAMLEEARRRAARLGRDVTLMVRDLTDTRLPSASFDCVVGSFVLCCVAPPAQFAALSELGRVARRGGSIYLLDYTLPSQPALRAFMRMTAPWIERIFAARYDTQPESRFERAGLQLLERREFMGGAVALHVLRAA